MNASGWDGRLPLRRYAIFSDILCGEYAIVVKGDDIARAEKWGGFVSWLGGVRPAETRVVRADAPAQVRRLGRGPFQGGVPMVSVGANK